jgi:hypothetical protein
LLSIAYIIIISFFGFSTSISTSLFFITITCFIGYQHRLSFRTFSINFEAFIASLISIIAPFSTAHLCI